MANNDILTEDDVRRLIYDLLEVESAAREAQNNQEVINRQAGDDLLGQLIAQETEERQTALSALQTANNQSITRIDGNVTQLQQIFNQKYDSLTASVSNVGSAISIIQGNENTVGSIAKALFDAKAYTDQKVEEILGGAPQMLDTLKELADVVGGNSNLIANIDTTIENLYDGISDNYDRIVAEGDAREAGDVATLSAAKAYADAKKLELLNTLSQDLIKKTIITLTQQQIDQGYIVLPHTNIVVGSMGAFINRIAIFENEDFEITIVGQTARLIFLNSLAIGGAEEVQAGEQLRLTYWSL